jgi:hypothetical protein
VAIGSLLHKACQYEFNDARIVEIRACMWKLWPVKNHKWMKTFHSILGEKINKKENKGMKILDEKSYI